MTALQQLAATLPDAAKDVRLNLTAVVESQVLTPAQAHGVALAVALAARAPELAAAVRETAGGKLPEPSAADAQAAAALMAMNNVYYRFRHMVGKPEYEQLPPRLRMQRLGAPASNKVDLELFALAVSAVNGCETCVQAHEQAVLAGGLTSAHVHEAVRIASVYHAGAVALSWARPGTA